MTKPMPPFHTLAPQASPACTASPSVYNSAPDMRGRRWGTESGASCAFKLGDGQSTPVFTWETAPRCLAAPSLFTATASDARGRLWGYELGRSCAFKAADGSDRPLYDFLTAPA